MKKTSPQPPRLARWLASLFLSAEDRQEKLGDMEEGYIFEYHSKSQKRARTWYLFQTAKIVPFSIKNALLWSFTMFKNYLKIAIRNLKRHTGYSLINIAGLALGMACCLLILSWIRDEMSTDTFHQKADSLYLVRSFVHYGSHTDRGSGSVPALGPALKGENPEVLNAARINNGQGQHLLSTKDKKFKEDVQMADPEIFELFTLPFVKGNPEDTKKGVHVIVLSERMAAKFFGKENPIGKTLTMDNERDFEVVGVMQDIPHNSTISFDIWVPLELSRSLWRPNYIDTWFNMAFRTYVEMDAGFDLGAFNKKIFNRVRESDPNTNIEPFLYPFKKVYLEMWGRMEQIRIFGAIGLLILVIACINFMNLTTARSAKRSREVGLRKVLGAYRRQVLRQFFGESLLLTLVSMLLAVGLVWIFLPVFRSLTFKPLHFGDLFHPTLIAGALGIVLFTGFLAGIYPAVFLSGFRPVSVLKNAASSGTKGALFRKVLVVIQFSISIILIIGTAVIYGQVNYMKSKSLGFDKEHLLYLPVEGRLKNSYAAVKQKLLQNPGIQSVSLTTHSPTGIYNNGQDWDWEGRDPNVNPLVTYFGVDADFLDVFRIEMSRGESFVKGTPHSGDKVLINETFAGIINLENIIGTRISQPDRSLRIIGVVKDFHFTPVSREIGPIIIYHNPLVRPYRYMFLRLNPGDVSQTVSFVGQTVKEFNPDFPFTYRFLDEDYDRMYRYADREMGLVQMFTILAVVISCLGLFGLAAFTAEQRTKEIGIRKVLGASVSGIMVMLSKEYAKWVLVANIIAWPVAYFFMHSWLRNYYYRISLGLPVFLLSALAALFIAQLTVSVQAFKAARSNPVRSLRYE